MQSNTVSDRAVKGILVHPNQENMWIQNEEELKNLGKNKTPFTSIFHNSLTWNQR
jgi:hypothetical protein